MTESAVSTVRHLLERGTLDVERPAIGCTRRRFRLLMEIARSCPLSVARLAEAHTDAVAILEEAGCTPTPGSLYGVWASQTGTEGVEWATDADTLRGSMGFASGLGIVDRALVTVRTGHGSRLVDIAVPSEPGDTVSFSTQDWSTPALTDTATGPITFRHHPIPDVTALGGPGWYLSRVGFWHGAIGPAACWAGGALGLVDAAGRFVDSDPHRRAHHGAMVAQGWQLASLLDAASDQIDDAPNDLDAAETRARSLRFIVATSCRDILDRFGRAFGPRPYVQDAEIAQRAADLDLYIKQHHGERELGALSVTQS